MYHIDSQEQAKTIILAIEKEFPVDTWKVNNIDVWPYIRIKLYFNLLSTSNAKNEQAQIKGLSVIRVPGKLNTLLQVLKSVFLLKVFFFKLKQKEILFFGAHFHRVLQDGKYFNRFYDSIIEHHALQNNIYIIEYLKVYKNTFNTSAVVALNKVLGYYKFSLKINPLKSFKKDIKLDKYDKFCFALQDYQLDTKLLGLSRDNILKWSLKMKSLERFYAKFYGKTKPSKIVFLGYYGYDDLYAALITANKMGIRTIDFQHGPQTNIHMAYSHWLKVPLQGFNTMPTEFWNWDINSKKNIDKWAGKIKAINVRVVGQPYIAYCKNKLKKYNLIDKVILYSLQTSPIELITPKVVRLIKNSNYTWVLRLHPRNNTPINDIAHFLQTNDIINKTVIESPVENSLPETLAKSICHITNYSGCAIESKMMGIPTLLIHKVGKEMFNDYIDNNLVYYINQSDERFIEKTETLIKEIEVQNFNSEVLEIFNPL